MKNIQQFNEFLNENLNEAKKYKNFGQLLPIIFEFEPKQKYILCRVTDGEPYIYRATGEVLLELFKEIFSEEFYDAKARGEVGGSPASPDFEEWLYSQLDRMDSRSDEYFTLFEDK
jgi:hypothetical protein